MTTPQRTLHLNAFLMSTGHHEASWRLPESNPHASTEIGHYIKLAQIAERGTFDSIFLADSPVIFGDVGQRPAGVLEPTVLLTAIAAAATRKIGLIVQAGSSEDGKSLAARYAEAVFTAQQTLEDAQSFYGDLKARTAALGRDPEGIKILPGIVPVIAPTEAGAKQLERELDELIRPEFARIELARTLRVAPEDLPLDRRLPAGLPDEDSIQGAKSRYTLIVDLARREKLTVRELIGRLGGGRGHRTFSGTPEQVADAIQLWFDNGAADGFNIMPAVLPSGLEAFVDHVVPILRRRGLFRDEYTADTLRGHYGLERPLNRYSGASGLSAGTPALTAATA